MFNKLLITVLLLLAGTLLIGQRFGFVWAGGKGLEQKIEVKLISDGEVFIEHNKKLQTPKQTSPTFISRGEILKTKDGTAEIKIRFIDYDEAYIYADINTDLRFDRLTPNLVVVTLFQGRILVEKNQFENKNQTIIVKTNYTKTVVDDALVSIVNYSFRDVVAVMPVATQVEIRTQNEIFLTDASWEIHEAEPIELFPIEFDPLSSVASEFYKKYWPDKGHGEEVREIIKAKTSTF